jgi:hypothetical protein
MSRRIKPHRVGGRQLEEVREKDPDGRIVYHHRTVDTLGKMLKAGTITEEMHDAARDLQASFTVAQFDPLRGLPILRVPGTRREPDLNERQLAPGAGFMTPCELSAASRARRSRAFGTSWVCSEAFGNGLSGRDGADGRCARSRHMGS